MVKYFEQRAVIKFCHKAEFTAMKMWEMFVNMFGDLSVPCATIFRWHSLFVADEESIEDAEQRGRLGTTKTNKNIARVTAVLKNDCRASCRMIAESTGYRKPSFTALCSMIRKNENRAPFVPHALTAEQWEQCVVHAKDLTIPVPSRFESTRLFCVSEVENGVEGGPICNHKRHSNICNDETEDYSNY